MALLIIFKQNIPCGKLTLAVKLTREKIWLSTDTNFFSFNNPYGACTKCEGYGDIVGIDERLELKNFVIPGGHKTSSYSHVCMSIRLVN